MIKRWREYNKYKKDNKDNKDKKLRSHKREVNNKAKGKANRLISAPDTVELLS